MAITAASLDRAVRSWKDELNALLNGTVTQARVQPQHLAYDHGKPTLVALTLRRTGGRPGAPIVSRTYRTPLELIIGQHLAADVTKEGKFVLRTVKYSYRLAAPGQKNAVVHWDYERTRPRPEDRWCRHHLQGQPDVVIEKRRVPLKDLHLPTGYVAIEEVLRFCIVDLGVRPLQDDWDDRLSESYNRFRENLRCPLYGACDTVADLRTAR